MSLIYKKKELKTEILDILGVYQVKFMIYESKFQF